MARKITLNGQVNKLFTEVFEEFIVSESMGELFDMITFGFNLQLKPAI